MWISDKTCTEYTVDTGTLPTEPMFYKTTVLFYETNVLINYKGLLVRKIKHLPREHEYKV